MTAATIDRERVRLAIEQATRDLPAHERVAVAERVAREIARRQRRTRYPSPGALAHAIDPLATVETPALALIDRAVLRAVEHMETGGGARLAVAMPPQEGKSRRLTIATPLWLLVRNPNLRVGIASFESDNATTFSREVRNMIAAYGSGTALNPRPLAEDLLGISLRGDSTSVSRFSIAGHVGGLVAVGMRGGLTGKPLDCVSAETYIVTDRGRLTAADAYRSGITRVLAYDHAAGRAVWGDVEAARRVRRRRVVEVVTTGGRVLACTPDHRIYTSRGYVPAGSLRPGDALRALVAADRLPLREPVGRAENGRAKGDPPRTADLLHAPMLGRRHVAGVPDPVLLVRPVPAAQSPVDLLRPVRYRRADRSEPSGRMPAVHGQIPPPVVEDRVLLPELRERRALRPDDRTRELPVRDGHELRETLSIDATADPRPRRALLRGLLRLSARPLHPEPSPGDPLRADRAPHRRGSDEQSAGEPDHPLYDLSRRAPQVEGDTVAVVRRRGDAPVDVYDFQVAGARNFFAGGVLVHNCLIVDDPYKDREQADSPEHRAKVWQWWSNVAVPRLPSAALVILVQTRWHPDDLYGAVLAQERALPERLRRWEFVSIPAQAERPRLDDDGNLAPGWLPDALGRQPGVWLDSARGRAPEDWELRRAEVGELAWGSLYQQHPTPPEGAIFAEAHIVRNRRPLDHVGAPMLRAVALDPSAGGSDEFGIVAGYRGKDSRAYVTHDRSRRCSSVEGMRQAWLLAVDTQADEFVWEQNLAGPTMRQEALDAWSRIVRQARTLDEVSEQGAVDPFTRRPTGAPIDRDELLRSAAIRWASVEQRLPVEQVGPDADDLRQLAEVADRLDAGLLDAATSAPPAHLRAVTATVGKRLRATPVATAVETNKVSHVGTLPALELELTAWSEGQKSPGRLDAYVWLVTRLLAVRRARSTTVADQRFPTAPRS